jgi:hypothetical protein
VNSTNGGCEPIFLMFAVKPDVCPPILATIYLTKLFSFAICVGYCNSKNPGSDSASSGHVGTSSFFWKSWRHFALVFFESCHAHTHANSELVLINALVITHGQFPRWSATRKLDA